MKWHRKERASTTSLYIVNIIKRKLKSKDIDILLKGSKAT
jgi:hypothetical protein